MDKNNFFHDEGIYNEKSAEIILPIIFDSLRVNSVLDIGCGIGTWLSVAKKLGAEVVVGVDGDYVDRSLLGKFIDESEFRSFDLTLPFNLNRKFDLVICLEVVEHLPKESAETIVNSLINHSEIILFSAAIPGQGGQNHLNEQWPNFWIDIFEKKGFIFIDSVRPIIWNDKRIDFWYRQNIFLVVKGDHDSSRSKIFNHNFCVHPELFEFKLKELNTFQKQYLECKNELISIKSGNVPLIKILKILLKKILRFF